MKKICLIFIILTLLISQKTNAALYKGTINGKVAGISGFEYPPFNDSDPFTLTLFVNTSGLNGYASFPDQRIYYSYDPVYLFINLDVAGYQGSFTAFLLEIINDLDYDLFGIYTLLEHPQNQFNGHTADLGLTFIGPPSILQNDSLEQSFYFTDFTSQDIGFDVECGSYIVSLSMENGYYGPVVPEPSTFLLILLGIGGIIGYGRKRIRQ